MIFNSFEFILLFLPFSVILYFLGNKINFTIGKVILLVSSAVFYILVGSEAIIVMLFSLVLNYVFSLFIYKASKFNGLFLLIPIVINIVILLFFKYYNFTIRNMNVLFNLGLPLKEILLPLGVSFYTFQQIAYLVAVYNKEISNSKLLDYSIFILFYPKILMGPLMDPVDFNNQLNDDAKKKINWDNIAYGLKIFSFGLFKKLILADVFFEAITWGNSNIEILTSAESLLLMLSFTFEIYFDFSGYSDMATGISLMLNIELPQNFNSPYKALSIRDFWKRWHMSLTKFFTKYVYIPLGGSRKGKLFTWTNTLIVFLISGLWHGSNWAFVLWGLLNGLLCCLEREFDRILNKIYKPIRWLATFVLINILWLLFNIQSISDWISILIKIFSFNSFNITDNFVNQFFSNGVMIIYFVASFALCLFFENNYNNIKQYSFWTMLLSAFAFIMAFISISNESIFLYLGF